VNLVAISFGGFSDSCDRSKELGVPKTKCRPGAQNLYAMCNWKYQIYTGESALHILKVYC